MVGNLGLGVDGGVSEGSVVCLVAIWSSNTGGHGEAGDKGEEEGEG